MNQEEFIEAIKISVEKSSLKIMETFLTKPLGRNPAKRLINLSNWYNNLSNEDQSMVINTVKESVGACVFQFLCVLDGVKIIENGEDKGRLVLYYQKNNVITELNGPNQEFLHEIYNAE
jgi:hypothetical protein